MPNFTDGYKVGKDLAEIRINLVQLGDRVNQVISEVNSLKTKVRELEVKLGQIKK